MARELPTQFFTARPCYFMVALLAVDYVCLAAGKGTRFGELGRYLQKCMYPVGLKPFLEFSVRNLVKSRYINLQKDRLTLIIGHYGEQVRRYFGGSYDGLAIGYLEQPEAFGTGHALYLAYEALEPKTPVIAWLADAYIPTERFEKLQRHPEANVQTVGPGHADEKGDLKVTLRSELVSRAWRGEMSLYDIGSWKLSPDVLALMTREQHGEYRMVPNLQLAIEQGHRVGFIEADEWVHLGGTTPTPEENVRAVAARLLELEALS